MRRRKQRQMSFDDEPTVKIFSGIAPAKGRLV